jgi:hypothetical protein
MYPMFQFMVAQEKDRPWWYWRDFQPALDLDLARC